jgi:hypothetical protein
MHRHPQRPSDGSQSLDRIGSNLSRDHTVLWVGQLRQRRQFTLDVRQIVKDLLALMPVNTPAILHTISRYFTPVHSDLRGSFNAELNPRFLETDDLHHHAQLAQLERFTLFP